MWQRPGRYDLSGRFWDLTGVEAEPKPHVGRLPVLNAGSSVQGRAYAARNADFVFTIVNGPEDGADVVKQLQSSSAELGRAAGVLTPTHVVCRPTRGEAEDYLHYYADENADRDAVDNLMRLQGLHAQSFTPDMLATFRSRFAAGHGTCPLVGTPDDVADEIERSAQAGFAGITGDNRGTLTAFGTSRGSAPRLIRGVHAPGGPSPVHLCLDRSQAAN